MTDEMRTFTVVVVPALSRVGVAWAAAGAGGLAWGMAGASGVAALLSAVGVLGVFVVVAVGATSGAAWARGGTSVRTTTQVVKAETRMLMSRKPITLIRENGDFIPARLYTG